MKNCGFFVFLVFDKNKKPKALENKGFPELYPLKCISVLSLIIGGLSPGISREDLRPAATGCQNQSEIISLSSRFIVNILFLRKILYIFV